MKNRKQIQLAYDNRFFITAAKNVACFRVSKLADLIRLIITQAN